MKSTPCNFTHQKAQSTVELALLTPAIFMLLLLIAQFGLIVSQQITLTHAAREAARAVAVSNNPQVATQAALAATNLARSRLQVEVTGSASPGEPVTVQLSYTSPTDVPIVGPLIGDITLRSSVTALAEGQS